MAKSVNHVSGPKCQPSFRSHNTMGTLTLAEGATHHAFSFLGDFTTSSFHIVSGATTTIAHA